MRNFFVQFANKKRIMSQPELASFIYTAVLRNKDIQYFTILELDDRLTPFQAATVAFEFNLADEVIRQIKEGDSPLEALLKWVKYSPY